MSKIESIFTILLGAISMALRAFVFTKMWQWFVMTHIPAKELGMGAAYGLILMVGLFSMPTAEEQKRNGKITVTLEERLASIGGSTIANLIVLVIGYLLS